MHRIFHNSKLSFLASCFLLSAIFSGAFSFVFAGNKQTDSAEMVYCPLTKKLQPVNPPAKNFKQKTLKDICASDDDKNQFALTLSEKINFNFASLNAKQFENLIFDYFHNGKSALNNLPDLPSFPNKNLAKTFISAAIFGNGKENKFIWKIQTENFSFARNPRPPDFAPQANFSYQIIRNSDEISLNINPRSPPFFS